MTNIVGMMKATLACAILVAMIFSIPTILASLPLQVGVSISSWKSPLALQKPSVETPNLTTRSE